MARLRAPKRTADLHILDEALTAFHRETGLHVEKRRAEFLAGKEPVDALVRINEPAGPVEYLAEIRRTVTEPILGQLKQKFTANPGKWIVIVPYVPAYIAKKMRDLGLQFMDAAGNAYVDDAPLLIFLYGNRAKEPIREKGEEVAFNAGAIRIIFALLCEPRLLNATYRELGAAAGTALGTVAGVMKALAADGYLLDIGTKRLVRKQDLVDRWTRAYATRFRGQQLIGRFAADRADLWKDLQLGGRGALWGGEVAVNKLLHHLKPAITTLYAHKPVDALAVDLRLRKDDRGPIELRERFWRFRMTDPVADTVPPLLVYADLLATADARNIEAAQEVYDRFLKKHLT